MAELKSKEPSPDCTFSKGSSKSCKSASASNLASTNPLNLLQQLVFVRYRDHVLYNRSSALQMQPQNREAIGWLVYDCELYMILAWDRDADPPTLRGGDPKASGLVLLKSDILEFQKLRICMLPLQNSLKWNLNRKQPIQEDEFALQPKKRKTQSEGE